MTLGTVRTRTAPLEVRCPDLVTSARVRCTSPHVRRPPPHLVCFAAYLAAGFAQLQIMKRSKTLAPALRDDHEKLAAASSRRSGSPRSSAPSSAGSVRRDDTRPRETGVAARQPPLCSSCLSLAPRMFRARKIVRAREAERREGERRIDARREKHELFGLIRTAAAVGLLLCVTFVRLRG